MLKKLYIESSPCPLSRTVVFVDTNPKHQRVAVLKDNDGA